MVLLHLRLSLSLSLLLLLLVLGGGGGSSNGSSLGVEITMVMMLLFLLVRIVVLLDGVDGVSLELGVLVRDGVGGGRAAYRAAAGCLGGLGDFARPAASGRLDAFHGLRPKEEFN